MSILATLGVTNVSFIDSGVRLPMLFPLTRKNPMHPDASFWNGLLLFLAAISTVVYGVGVMIALFFGIFRRRAALLTSYGLSAIVSVPFVLYCVLIFSSGSSPEFDEMWLPDPIDDWPIFRLLRLSIVVMLLLCFVWVTPAIQYYSTGNKNQNVPSESESNKGS